MTIRLLLTNGCSLTRGQELAEPELTAWPAVLGRALGIPVANLARDGSSNRRILRTTVRGLFRTCQRFAVEPHETLVVVMWTHPSRVEFLPATDGRVKKASVPERSWEYVQDDRWQTIGPWQRRLPGTAARAFYRHLWSEEGQQSCWVLDWMMCDAWLRDAGCHPRYVLGYPFEDDRMSPHVPLDALDSQRIFGGALALASPSFLGETFTRLRGPAGHPLEDSHMYMSERLESWLASDSRLDLATVRT